MPRFSNLRIYSPNDLGKRLCSNEYTIDDGLGFWKEKHYIVENSIIDLSGIPTNEVDEALSIIYGASAVFDSCLIRGASKLILCGSGERQVDSKECGKEVVFANCIIEDFGRRGPEVQAGMSVILESCLIRNWGRPEYFSIRNFGAWAHSSGFIQANNCVFWQDHFSFSNLFKDIANHVSQAVNDHTFLSVLNPFNYIPGICRGLTGNVEANNCYKNHWWIKLDNRTASMPETDAQALISKLEKTISRLE